MSAIVERAGIGTRRRGGPVENVESLVAERAAADLVVLAQELLLLDPTFERAYPRERTRHAAPGIAAATRRVLRRDSFEPFLSRILRKELESLASPPARGAAPPTMRRLQSVVDEALDSASALAPRSGSSHVVRAQRNWLVDGAADDARRGFEIARDRARSPRAAASALLHLAILHADRGDLDPAHRLLAAAAQLHPRSLAIAWTLAVYALASGRARTLEQQLPAITRNGDPSTLRRRALALDGHLRALARVGVLAESAVRARGERFLARLFPLPPAHEGGDRR